MKPLVTVLVDTFNHERYIEQALVSVLEQGLSPSEMEIVVVDDGSTDNTSSIIQKFLPRVKHLRKKNGGQASAFNSGFAEAHGQTIAILDGDDWWAEKKLAKVVDALEKNPEVAGVGHGYYEFHDGTKEGRVCVPPKRIVVNTATPDATRAAFCAWPYLLPSALTVRRRVLEWIMPIPEAMYFMADSAIQAAAMVMGTIILDEPLCYYRYHAQNLYAIDPRDMGKLRRKYEMAELVYSGLYKKLVDLGVPEESASILFEHSLIEVKRSRLSRFGGGHLEAFHTEMQAFRMVSKNPSAGYRLFKYLVVGAAAMVLPARRFYKLRDWYAAKQLGRHRQLLFRADLQDSSLRKD